MKRTLWSIALAAAVCACGKSNDATPDAGPVDAGPPLIHTTYRAIGGISMGGIGASSIGLHHPELFDTVVALGGPLDGTYLPHMILDQLMSGFCTREQLEAQLAANPALLNDPSVMTCVHLIPGDVPMAHTENFANWQFTQSGGAFDRSSYLDLFYDLTNAFGNLASYNPDSLLAPTGIPEDIVRHPPADLCTHPYVVKGKLSDPNGHPIYNAEYNPEGKYDAITFCDGEEYPVYWCPNTGQVVNFCAPDAGGAIVPKDQEQAYATAFCGSAYDTASSDSSSATAQAIYRADMGKYDPCREHSYPARVVLAFDYNGNGRRDYAEPIVVNAHERFDDVGADGCDDAHEDGHGGCVTDPSTSPFAQGVADPNGDDFDIEKNPLGTEKNFRHDDGEPFQDTGLDGVAGTGDYGEGNGQYDEAPGLQRWRAYDPRENYLKLDAGDKHRLNVYVEGGIRDVFNFGVAADRVAGAIKATSPDGLDVFHGFAAVTATTPPADEASASAREADWAKVTQNVCELYGDPDAGPDEILAGDGDHVGTNGQALKRTDFMETYVASRWPNAPPAGGGNSGDEIVQGQFFSQALGANRDFSIYLPPGYNDPSQAGTHYPLLVLLHGYGGDHTQLEPVSLLLTLNMTDTSRLIPAANNRRYLVAFAEGRCCFENTTTHARDCTLVHDGEAGWESMCVQGSFYVNAAAPTNDAPQYEDGIIDLINYVDLNYRTLGPADVVAR